MPQGNDLHQEQLSVAAAKQWCESHPECYGFTFPGVYNGDDNAVFTMIFKAVPAWAPGAGWQTFLASHEGGSSSLPGEPTEEQPGHNVSEELELEGWLAAMDAEEARRHNEWKMKMNGIIGNNKQKRTWNPFEKKYKSKDM